MKRLALALSVVALVACKKAEEAAPAADTTHMAAPAAPGMDSAKMMDSTKMAHDTSKTVTTTTTTTTTSKAPAARPASGSKKPD